MSTPCMVAGIAEGRAPKEAVAMWPQRVVGRNEARLCTVSQAAGWQDCKLLYAEVLVERLVELEGLAHLGRALALPYLWVAGDLVQSLVGGRAAALGGGHQCRGGRGCHRWRGGCCSKEGRGERVRVGRWMGLRAGMARGCWGRDRCALGAWWKHASCSECGQAREL